MADSRLIRFSYLYSGHSYKECILGRVQLNKLEYFCHSLQPPFCFSCCEEATRLGYIASVSRVSPPGEHISLVISVRGNTYHGETHITVTPALPRNRGKTEKRAKERHIIWLLNKPRRRFGGASHDTDN